MTPPTPGRRLHAALLAQDIERDRWDDCHPTYQEAYEAAAREYDEGRPYAPRRAILGPDQPGAFVAARGRLAPGWGDDPIAAVDAPHCPLCTKELPRHAYGCSESKDALRDRLDALTAEVAALRRDRDADLAAFREIGDRLARLESTWMAEDELTERQTVINALQRHVAELSAAVDMADAVIEARVMDRIDARLSALEARALGGGDPLHP